MDALIAIFFASFFFVAIKAFQQRNVAFDHYLAIIPTSLIMAVAEAYIIVKIATTGYYSISLVLSMGLGAGLGALGASILHKKIFKENNNE